MTIQCKTNQLSKNSWVLNEKCESFVSENHFYVFVVLGKQTERPRYHVVPSNVVAEAVRSGHRKWLDTPGRRGQPHKENKIRKFEDLTNEYLERWDLLDL